MATQRGSVTKEQGGKWRARYSAGKDPITGKRVQRWKRFDTKQEAEKWLTAELHSLDNGELQRRLTGGQTLGEYLTDFYVNDRRGLKGKLIAPRTCAVDLEMVSLYVIRRAPAIANTPIARVTTDALSRLFRLLAEGDDTHGGLSRATVSRVFRILRARLTHAVKLGLIRANPMRSDLIPVEGKAARPQHTLNAAQVRALLAVCAQDRYGLLFAVSAWTGVRPGEASGLTWDDIDTEGRALIIRRALVRITGAVELRGTKTGRTRRVRVPASLIQQLQAHRRLQAAERLAAGPEYADLNLVFATRFGLPVHLDRIAQFHFKPLLVQAAYHLLGRERPSVPPPSRSEAYRDAVAARDKVDAEVMREAAFPAVSMYSLRHTQATVLLGNNVHAKIAADRLGHSRTSTTLDQYSHVTPDMQSAALEVLEAAFSVPLVRKQG